jgi:hypothetical protein
LLGIYLKHNLVMSICYKFSLVIYFYKPKNAQEK